MSRIKRHKLKKSVVREAPKKKGLSKKAILTFIIGGVMILSVFGIMFSSYNSGIEEVEYGDYEFQRTNTGWKTDIDGKKAEFSYLPSDIEEFNMSTEVVDKILDSKVVYITFDPNATIIEEFELMRFELGTSLTQLFGIYSMAGVAKESEEYTLPLVSCENATAELPVISLTEANETNALVDGDCVIIEVNEYSAAALKDRLLYAMLGIIAD
jgi:hypothetical protein